MANASSIVSRVREAISSGAESTLSGIEDITPRDTAEAAEKGDKVAIEALAETGRALGTGLANVVHILNPEVIALGGGVAGAGELIMGPARETMRSHLLDDVLASVRVVPAELGNSASLIGAAMLALDHGSGC
jgi:glucokinase